MSASSSASAVERVPAHAKINLHLRILDTRPDGYHDVVTVLQALALHDDVICEAGEGPFAIRCDEPGVPLDERNLVWRAAVRLAEAAGRRDGIDGTRVTIVKRVPMQAGLGGGSADAAAALVGLARLWRIGVDRGVLHRLACGLGADVAFLLAYLLDGTGTMVGVGRGDELEPLAAWPVSDVALVMPPFGVSTVEAYRWHDERVAREGARLAAAGGPDAGVAAWPAVSAAWPGWLSRLSNDFERAVGARHPEIPRIVEALRAAGAVHAAMTGSGAAVFGLFGSSAAAAEASRLPAFARPGWRTFVTRTV